MANGEQYGSCKECKFAHEYKRWQKPNGIECRRHPPECWRMTGSTSVQFVMVDDPEMGCWEFSPREKPHD